jgi:hypothetical protein
MPSLVTQRRFFFALKGHLIDWWKGGVYRSKFPAVSPPPSSGLITVNEEND